MLVIAGTVQAATFINTCPFAITSPGDYLLAANLICGGGNGITITSSDVRLALEGHTITAGVGANRAILAVSPSQPPFILGDVRILGPGLITNGGGNAFANGVFFNFADHSEVSGVTVLGSNTEGIDASVADFLTITANTLGRNRLGIGLANVHSSTISGNDASGNDVGMRTRESFFGQEPLGTVSHNIFNGNTSDGLSVSAFHGATIQHNVANGNGGNGITLATVTLLGSSEVTNNRSLANGMFDLFDTRPNCSGNVWSGNKFFTANQSCIH